MVTLYSLLCRLPAALGSMVRSPKPLGRHLMDGIFEYHWNNLDSNGQRSVLRAFRDMRPWIIQKNKLEAPTNNANDSPASVRDNTTVSTAKQVFIITELRLAILEACDISSLRSLMKIPEFKKTAEQFGVWTKVRQQMWTYDDIAFVVEIEFKQFYGKDDISGIFGGPLFFPNTLNWIPYDLWGKSLWDFMQNPDLYWGLGEPGTVLDQ